MSNFDQVTDWMEEIGQGHGQGNPRVLDLRSTLITEEYLEALEAIADAQSAWRHGRETPTEVVKELCDLLVVTYGTLAELGVDGDTAFDVVMEENRSKVHEGERRGDGKWVVPADVKRELKRRTEARLEQCLRDS